MSELKELQQQEKHWKEVGEMMKLIHDKLDGRRGKKEWHYKIQLQMLLTKAEEYASTYEDKIKEIQVNNV